MSANLVALCGFIYLYVCFEQALKGQWSMATMYLGYAVANIGAYQLAIKGIHE